MFEALFFGFTQGFVIGPVSLFGIHEGLERQKGFWYQMQVSFGSSCVDIVYLLLATAGVAQIVDHFWVRLIMWTAASYMLIVMGLNSFYERPHKMSFHHLHRHKQKMLEMDFFKGFFLALFNPLAIIFWIMVAGSLYADLHNKLSPVLFAFLVTLGTLIAAFLRAAITLFLKRIFDHAFLKKLVALSSLILIGYGIWFFSRATFEVMETVFQ